LTDGSDCVGVLLYSAEYELGFSSLFSEASARKLPRSVTIFCCYVPAVLRDRKNSRERTLVKFAISHLRSIKSVETVALQPSPSLYEMKLEGPLARMGFMNCSRMRMERRPSGRIPSGSMPLGCKVEPLTDADPDELRSVIQSSYFSEIDGYLFPDIAAVCSDGSMFREFLSSNTIDKSASVIARVYGHPCGCVIVLSSEDRQTGLIGVVGVSPGMRRRGIGRAMLLSVLRRLQEHGATRVALAVTMENYPAYSLYSSLGFMEVGPPANISVWRRSVSRPLMNFPP
jgi:GNAT superfamily N-acetyltransferase